MNMGLRKVAKLNLKEQEVFAKLCECDPDYIVDVLEISSRELLHTFLDRAINHIREEYDVEDEEGSDDGPNLEEEWETYD